MSKKHRNQLKELPNLIMKKIRQISIGGYSTKWKHTSKPPMSSKSKESLRNCLSQEGRKCSMVSWLESRIINRTLGKKKQGNPNKV